MMSKTGLNKEEIEAINGIFEQYAAIEKVLLYGSRAKGNFKQSSDIDLSIIGDNLDLELLQSIEFELDDLLLPYKFDISIYEKISDQEFLNHINRNGIIFYTK
jgi:predicted nucleotidyltransferase